MPKATAHKVGMIEQAMGLLKHGDAPGAEKLCRVVLRGNAKDAWAIHASGLVAHQMGRQEEAVAKLTEAAKLAPGQPEFWNNLGAILGRLGKMVEAAEAFEKAVRLRPDDGAGFVNLAMAQERAGNRSRAHAASTRAVELQPEQAEAHAALGTALRGAGRLDDSKKAYARAIVLQSDFAPAVAGLAAVCEAQGDYAGAIDAYRRAVALNPDDAGMHSNLLFTLFYDPTLSAEQLRAEHAQWNVRHAKPLYPTNLHHVNDRSPERRLRIGYVSADFRRHSVARFLEPLIAVRDREKFEVLGYSDVVNPDEVTTRIRAACDHWRVTLGSTDADVANLIRRDGIDILIDPTGHMGNNRLLVFARKPVPIQIAFPGYPGSCGLETMDYFVTDRLQNPEGSDASGYTEKWLYVEPTSRCYQLDEGEPEPGPLPADERGYITFGSLNRPIKVTERMVGVWAKLLGQIPGSRLLFLAGDHAEEGSRRHLQWFAEQGIERDRIEVVASQPRDAYLKLFHRVDIALDTFPYAGCTTTCDALWMGVPTISLVGDTYVSRVGSSVLEQVGLREFTTDRFDRYVEIARAMAEDRAKLRALRQSLRERFAASSLVDRQKMVNAWQTALRWAWREWCVKD